MELSLNSSALSVDTDIDEAFKVFSRLNDGFADNAVRIALDDIARQARTRAKREIRQLYRLSDAQARSQLSVGRASRDTLQSWVGASGKRLPAYMFSKGQAALGAQVNITGNTKVIDHTFIATMPSGHIGIFERTGVKTRVASGRNKGKLKQQIQEVMTIGVAPMFASERISAQVCDLVQTKFPQVLRGNIQYLIERGQNPEVDIEADA